MKMHTMIKELYWGKIACVMNSDTLSFPVQWVDGQMQYPRILDEPIDEDSGDAFSPEQPGSQESQGSAASPGEVRTIEESSPVPNNLLQVVLLTSEIAHGAKIQNLVFQVLQYTDSLFLFSQHFPAVTSTSTDFLKPFPTNEQSVSPPAPMPQLVTVAPVKSGSTLVKVSEEQRRKNNKNV